MPENAPLVLAADDLPINLALLSAILHEGGYRVETAENGAVALAKAETLRPDVILLDVLMPELDGFETCKRLKEQPALRDIPVLFLTALSESEGVLKGFSLGAVDYVLKPFNPEELLARVGTHVALRRAVQARQAALEEKDRVLAELQAALDNVKRLAGLLPMCAHCKKVRSDAGYWQQVEQYLHDRSDLCISHGICPECMREHYSQYLAEDQP